MPTPAERKALLFLAGVIVLGAGVRVLRAARDDRPSDVASRQALARQLSAVDSARARPDSRGRSRSAARRTGGRRAKTDSLPRADTIRAMPVVDLDVATQSEIETLPRIGPVLARRILEDRSANGPFGSLDGFQRVRGVGPAMAAAVASRVTFSGTMRPSNAVVDPRLRSVLPSRSPTRRDHKK